MNIFAGLVKGKNINIDNVDLKGEFKYKNIGNNSLYLVGQTQIETSKEIVDLFENLEQFDISILTEDKIVFIKYGKEINFEKISLEGDYKSISYDGFDFEEVLKQEFSGLNILREVEKGRFTGNRIIRLDIFN